MYFIYSSMSIFLSLSAVSKKISPASFQRAFSLALASFTASPVALDETTVLSTRAYVD